MKIETSRQADNAPRLTRKSEAFVTQEFISQQNTPKKVAMPMTIDRNEMNRRLIRLAESPNIRFWRVDYDELSFAERVFGLIWELESEVNNGGFHQYFLNSTGALAPHIVEALKAVGAVQTAALVQEAIAQVGSVPWSDDAARKTIMNALSSDVIEKLNKLDQSFYAYPNDLTELLYRYVDKHRVEIGVPDNF